MIAALLVVKRAGVGRHAAAVFTNPEIEMIWARVCPGLFVEYDRDLL